jgi:phage shock protein C
MTQPTATAPYKQLRRPTTDRIVAGVASGIGRYFNVDPTLVRAAFVIVAIITWGTALLAYPVLWFVMPEEPPQAPAWPTDGYAGATPTAGADPAWTATPPTPTPPIWTPPTGGTPGA